MRGYTPPPPNVPLTRGLFGSIPLETRRRLRINPAPKEVIDCFENREAAGD